MSRRGAVALLALGAIPFLYLLVFELIAAITVLGVLSSPAECLSEAPAATLATIWLAFGPLSAGIAAAIAGLRRGGPAAGAPRAGLVGLVVLGSGVVICLLGSGKPACAAAEWPGGSGESVPIASWGTASVLILALTFGAICFAALLDDDSSDGEPPKRPAPDEHLARDG